MAEATGLDGARPCGNRCSESQAGLVEDTDKLADDEDEEEDRLTQDKTAMIVCLPHTCPNCRDGKRVRRVVEKCQKRCLGIWVVF